ncbi:MAG: NGG1p interacting factor NIF3 [Clostridia bacterium]|nr:NGG1p interacting factor NIF3 [Clostridia bacterium]
MKLAEIYALAINLGMNADPRGRAMVEQELADQARAYAKMSGPQRQFFDRESLINPYADTRIVYGDPQTEISKLIAGIDMQTAELLLARQLNQEGAEIGLALSHHAHGRALLGLPQVMRLQPAAWTKAGLPAKEAEQLMAPRYDEVALGVGGGNYNRTVDAARLLGLPLMCAHTACDNLVSDFIDRLMRQEQPDQAADVLTLLLRLPEIAAAAQDQNPPRLVAGKHGHAAGKIFVDMTGGASPPADYYRLAVAAGISTVICMSAKRDIIDAADEAGLNVVVAGHMACDSIGMNLF